MLASELFATLTTAGCQLQARGATLRVFDPQQRLTDGTREAIRAHKQELLALLAYRRFRDVLELWEERSAIVQYEAGLSRDESEYHAFLYVKEQCDVFTQ